MTVDPSDARHDDLTATVEHELDQVRSSGEDDPVHPPESADADPGEVEWYESGLRNLEGAIDPDRPHDS